MTSFKTFFCMVIQMSHALVDTLDALQVRLHLHDVHLLWDPMILSIIYFI